MSDQDDGDFDSEQPDYIVATSANRALHNRRSAGVALSSGDTYNLAVEMQSVGVVPPYITGLGAGAESLIQVSSTGSLQRADDYTLSQDIVGYCDEDGTAYVCFP